MKLAFTIATIAALYQAAVTRAECDFGSNYTTYYFNSSGSAYCSFDAAAGEITLSSESKTISSGDTNVTTSKKRHHIAFWKMGDKESTLQCYPNITRDRVSTAYPNGSTFTVDAGDLPFGLDSVGGTAVDGVPINVPGLYYFQGGRIEYWIDKDYWTVTDAEGDIITDLCEVLGLGGGGGDDAAGPTPTPPTTEAPSSGHMAAVTIIPCAAAAILNYFFSL